MIEKNKLKKNLVKVCAHQHNNSLYPTNELSLLKDIQQATDGKKDIAIIGPSGTGKTDLAERISKINGRKHIRITMDPTNPQLSAAKLFGVKKGALGPDSGADSILETNNSEDVDICIDEVGYMTESEQTLLYELVSKRKFQIYGDAQIQTFKGRVIILYDFERSDRKFTQALHRRLDFFQFIYLFPLYLRTGDIRNSIESVLAKEMKHQDISQLYFEEDVVQELKKDGLKNSLSDIAVLFNMKLKKNLIITKEYIQNKRKYMEIHQFLKSNMHQVSQEDFEKYKQVTSTNIELPIFKENIVPRKPIIKEKIEKQEKETPKKEQLTKELSEMIRESQVEKIKRLSENEEEHCENFLEWLTTSKRLKKNDDVELRYYSILDYFLHENSLKEQQIIDMIRLQRLYQIEALKEEGREISKVDEAMIFLSPVFSEKKESLSEQTKKYRRLRSGLIKKAPILKDRENLLSLFLLKLSKEQVHKLTEMMTEEQKLTFLGKIEQVGKTKKETIGIAKQINETTFHLDRYFYHKLKDIKLNQNTINILYVFLEPQIRKRMDIEKQVLDQMEIQMNLEGLNEMCYIDEAIIKRDLKVIKDKHIHWLRKEKRLSVKEISERFQISLKTVYQAGK